MSQGFFKSSLEEEPVEDSQQDGVPRYGERIQPDWGPSLSEEAERSRRSGEIIAEPLDDREFDQNYAPREVAKEANRNLRGGLLFSKSALESPKVDPDETELTDSELVPEASYAMEIPGAELPTEDNPEGWHIRDGVNFLFGEDMAILGLKWDEDGVNWAIENALDQWSEHPVMSSVAAAGLAASIAFPAFGVLRKSAKVGRLAQKGVSKYIPEGIQTSRLQLGQRATKGLLEKSLLEHGDDWVRTLDDLLAIEDELGTGLKYFEPEDAARLKQMIDSGRGADAVSHVGIGEIKKRLLGMDHRRRFEQLRWKIDFGKASKLDQMRFNLQKRFANDYFMIGAGMTPGAARKITEFFDNSAMWKLFEHEIPEEHHKLWYRYMSGLIDENDTALNAIRGNQASWHAWRGQRNAYVEQQSRMLSSGFFTADEVASFSLPDPSVHVKVETVGQAVARGLYTSTIWNTVVAPGAMRVTKKGIYGKTLSQTPATLTSPSLLHRAKYGTPEALEAGIQEGKIIVDPALVNQFSLVHDKLLLNTYDFLAEQVIRHRNLPNSGLNKWFVNASTYDELTDAAKTRWVNLNDLGGEIASRFRITGTGPLADRLRRMVAVKLGKEVDDAGNIIDGMDDLPYMNVEIFNDFFHPEKGMFGAMSYSTDALSLLTAVHKTARTALNPATHLTNLSGNFVMLAMAGMNPFGRQAINDGSRMTKVFREVAKSRINSDIDSDLLFSKTGLVDVFARAGVDTEMVTKLGTRIDLTDDFSHPLVQQLIEKNAFETTEGFANLQKTLQAIEAAERSAAGTPLFAKAVSKTLLTAIGENPGRRSKLSKGLHHMSSLYLQEDMVPKAMYFMNLRRQGHSIESAVMEVGRRLPQYKNVGNSIKGLRKFALPWITFPAEMTRIMKNNLMDYPLRTAAILRIPNAMQWALGEASLSPSTPEEVSEGLRQAPLWAQKGTSVLMNGGKTTAAALAGSTGAFTGAVVGGASWGTIGAMVGAFGGGAVGAATGYGFGEEEEKHMRSWTMDFLPWSSLMASSTSPEAEPFGMRQWLDLSPVEPFAVLMPLVRLAMGRGSFGEELLVNSNTDAVGKSVMQMFGFIAPPLIQKYGLRVGEPKTGFFNLADSGGRLGAMAAGGLIGAAGGVSGAAIGATTGLLTGANTTRLEEDLGLRQNSRTGERGNFVYDILLNSITGMGKSWKATPEQRLFYENLRRDRFLKKRRVAQKNMDAAIMNGDEEMFNRSLGQINRTFMAEYFDPNEATVKFGEYADRRLDKLGLHPRLKGWSQEQLRARLWEAVEFAKENRSKAADDLVQALHKELLLRELAKESKGFNVGGYDYDLDLATGLLRAADLKPKKSKRRSKRKSGRGTGIIHYKTY